MPSQTDGESCGDTIGGGDEGSGGGDGEVGVQHVLPLYGGDGGQPKLEGAFNHVTPGVDATTFE